MGKYKKCPRCELNYILNEEELCGVCKAELGKGGIILMDDDDDEEILFDERVCPECKINYLADDEKICATCRAEQLLKKGDDDKEDDSWREFIEEDAVPIDSADEDNEISLEMLGEDESENDDDEIEDVDDFDDDFEDFDDIADDDEDESEDEDF